MTIGPIRLDVGKIRSTGKLYPWEPGYVASVRKQCDELQAIIKDMMDQVETASPQICYNALEPTFQKSQVWCPVDTGAMKSSGYLEIVGFRGQPRVEMGYGRGGMPIYTVLVHENLEMRHAAPTRAKWLEAAIDDDLFQIQDNIVKGHKRLFETAHAH